MPKIVERVGSQSFLKKNHALFVRHIQGDKCEVWSHEDGEGQFRSHTEPHDVSEAQAAPTLAVTLPSQCAHQHEAQRLDFEAHSF